MPNGGEALLEGLDDIGMTLKLAAAIRAFEAPTPRRVPGTTERPRRPRETTAGAGRRRRRRRGRAADVDASLDWFVAERGLADRRCTRNRSACARWEERGTLMSDETWQQIVDADAILFGAIGSPDYTHDPRPRSEGRLVARDAQASSTCTRTSARCACYEPLARRLDAAARGGARRRHGDRARAVRWRLLRRAARHRGAARRRQARRQHDRLHHRRDRARRPRRVRARPHPSRQGVLGRQGERDGVRRAVARGRGARPRRGVPRRRADAHVRRQLRDAARAQPRASST